MNNIFILNFWWSGNYGAILTALALSIITNSVLVDNSTKKILKSLNIDKKNISFDFIKKKLNKIVESKNSKYVLLNAKVLITGSDQVFRPNYTNDMTEDYLLDFASINTKKIAFSASFGVDKEQFLKETSTDKIEKMKNSLKSFDFISVREKSGVEICKDLFDVDAEWIIDPVFILDKSKYDELIENVTPHPNPLPQGAREYRCSAQNDNNTFSNKIVAYVLDTSKEYKKAYKYLEKKYDKKVIETANSNISVESWLKSIRDCDLFVTDSFHGMCFAIIFNKPFICVANKSRGRTRFDSICEMLNIDNQCLDSIIEIYDKDYVFKINYEKVNQRIEEERQKGLDFLKKALDAPIKVTREKIDSRIKYLENKVTELEAHNNLRYQFKKWLWNKWLVIFYGLPTSIRNIILRFRGKR